MKFEDFVDERDGMGVCVTIPQTFAPYMKGEVVLSQCMIDGTAGAREAVEKMYDNITQAGPVGMRYQLMVTMAESEARAPGMLVTGKGNGAIATLKREFRLKRNLARWKVPVAIKGVQHLAALYADTQND